MQLIAEFVSGLRYWASSVMASPVALSSSEPQAKNAGQPFEQPFAAASDVGCVALGTCSTVTYAFVAVAPTNGEKSAAAPGCAIESGGRVTVLSPPICVPVLPSKSFTSSVVVENCDALAKPRFVRYVPVWPAEPGLRRPVMKTLSGPAALESDET